MRDDDGGRRAKMVSHFCGWISLRTPVRGALASMYLLQAWERA